MTAFPITGLSRTISRLLAALPAVPPTVLPTGLAAALLALLLTALPGPALAAAEFSIPPGQNVGIQEALLRTRVTRIARDLVGDKLVSVVAHVGYVRMQVPTSAAAEERIKLPGMNNFVSTKPGEMQVTPEYLRVRQVVVMVSDDLAPRLPALERDIRTQAEMDPAKGDWVEVVTVSAPKAAQTSREPAKTGAEAAKEAQAAKPGEGAAGTAAQPVLPGLDSLKEPQSTLFLVNARAAYFQGDYNRALDQILQAISLKPDNAQAYAMLGSLYYAMSWKSLALKYWEKSLALDPANRELEGLVTQLRLAQNG